MRGPSRRWARPALAAAITVIGSVVTFSVLGRSPDGEDKRPKQGCAQFSPAVDAADSSEVFDPTTGRLVIATGDASYVLSESDPACLANPQAQRRLANARLVEHENGSSSMPAVWPRRGH